MNTFHKAMVDNVAKNLKGLETSIIIKEGDVVKKYPLRISPFEMKEGFTDPDHIVIVARAADETNDYVVVTTYEKGQEPNCSFIDIIKKQIINTTLHRDNLISFLTSNRPTIQ